MGLSRDTISKRKVIETLNFVDVQLQKLKPDGKKVHNVGLDRATLIDKVHFLDYKGLEDISFEEYERLYPQLYETTVKCLSYCILKYGVRI